MLRAWSVFGGRACQAVDQGRLVSDSPAGCLQPLLMPDEAQWAVIVERGGRTESLVAE